MHTNSHKIFIGLAFVVLLFSGLACNLPGSRITQRPTAIPTSTPIPVASEEVKSLEENVQAAATQINTGETTRLVITEAQLNSLIATELKSQNEQIILDPQVLLRNGQITLTGKVQQSGLTLPLKLVLTVSVSPSGQPQYKIVTAELGPVPLPQTILNQISAQLDQAFASQIGPEIKNIVVENITIADGTLTVVGHSK
jgi:uncharacterized protein YpmS